MIKFNNETPGEGYSEICQTNPLRWVNLFREEDGSFTHQGYKWKCKDFMNEIVRKYQGQNSSIYGFNTNDIKVNEGGVWLHLLHIVNRDAFLANLGSINMWAEEQNYPGMLIQLVDAKDELVIFIPKKYFENTYSISFLTYFIRVANVGVVIDDWNTHPTRSIDSPFEGYWDDAMEQGFAPPVEGFWYYDGPKTNLTKPMTSTVHDCGVNSWMYAVKEVA